MSNSKRAVHGASDLAPSSASSTIYIIVDSGVEDACCVELRKLLPDQTVAMHANVLVLSGSPSLAAALAFRLQTARRVLLALVTQQPSVIDFEQSLPAPDEGALSACLPIDRTFKAEVDILSLSQPVGAPQAPNGQELAEHVGAWLHRTGRPVRLSKPDALVLAVWTPEALWIGVDMAGVSLSRREWRIMLSRRSLKSTIAAACGIYAGIEPTDSVLDPFADDGTIATEAGLLIAGASPHAHARWTCDRFPGCEGWRELAVSLRPLSDGADSTGTVHAFAASLHDLKSVRTHAKLAGVERVVHGTKVGVDWVETKLAPESIKRIVTAPPPSGKSLSPAQAARFAKELFWQAEHALAKNGTITCITEKPQELASQAGKWQQVADRTVFMGQREMHILTWRAKRR
jgi:23S rRNA G2445 N2-methylase RlmL